MRARRLLARALAKAAALVAGAEDERACEPSLLDDAEEGAFGMEMGPVARAMLEEGKTRPLPDEVLAVAPLEGSIRDRMRRNNP